MSRVLERSELSYFSIIRFEASNKAHVVVNTDSEGLQKRQNLQFCVQVFSTDTEFQELTPKEHKLGVFYCALTEANLPNSLSKKRYNVSKLRIHIFTLLEVNNF